MQRLGALGRAGTGVPGGRHAGPQWLSGARLWTRSAEEGAQTRDPRSAVIAMNQTTPPVSQLAGLAGIMLMRKGETDARELRVLGPGPASRMAFD